MKKLVIMVLVGFWVSSSSTTYSSDLRDNCGCGLGTLIFEGKDTLIIQIFAATFNTPSQVFGISSGTLGCEQPIQVARKKRLELFVSHNMDNLAKDVANGYGEYLETVAKLLNVAETDKRRWYTKLKNNFNSIFQTADTTNAHGDIVSKIVAAYQTI